MTENTPEAPKSSPRRAPVEWAFLTLALLGLLGPLGYLATGGRPLATPHAGLPAAEGAPSQPETSYPDIPRIDVHVHTPAQLAQTLLELMDENHVRVALNASGGAPGAGLHLSSLVAKETGGRIRPYCNFPFVRVRHPDFERFAIESLEACKREGAVGLKAFKSLGLGIKLADGQLLRIDDPRLDIVFEQAGALGLPVLIHSGDPKAFFDPPTEDNERYRELKAHPGWSFYGARPDGFGNWPRWEELLDQFEARVARHPNTIFVGAHFGNAPEEPARVARMLDKYPNLLIETAARIPEIGRHPAEEMRAFFEKYQDRILFGTDLGVGERGLMLGSTGEEPDPPERAPAFFRSQYRYFETRDEGFAHPTPIQGDWTIDGIGLGRSILEKVYWRNALRVFGIELPRE